VNKHCLAEFRKHWECLDNNNQQLWQCRKFERPLNKCVFDNLVRQTERRIWSPLKARPTTAMLTTL
jgi:IS1 family transposase